MPRIQKKTSFGRRNLFGGTVRTGALVLAFCFLRAPTRAAALPATAALIPSDSIVLVEIGDLAQLRQQFKNTSIYALYKDPAMGAFTTDARGKWMEAVSKIENAMVRSLVSAEVLPQSRVAMAAMAPAAGSKEQGKTILITQWGQSLEKIKQLIDTAIRKAAAAGSVINRQQYRGVNITSITAGDAGQTGRRRFDPPRTYYCFMDDYLLCSTDKDILEFAIAHADGDTSGTLAEQPQYSGAVRAVGRYDDIVFYLNLKRLVAVMDSDTAADKSEHLASKLGLDNVNSLAGSIGVARAAHSSIAVKSVLTVGGEKKGILRIMDARTTAVKAPRFVPASAYSLSILNLDIPQVYDELHRILYGFSPIHAALLGALNLPEGRSGEPALDFRRDVISHLGSQLVAAQILDRPFLTGDSAAESLLGVTIKDRTAVERALQLLHSRLLGNSGPRSKRQLLGYTMYLVRAPSLMPPAADKTPLQTPGGGSGNAIPPLAFSVTDTHLLFGPEGVVERAIRTLSDPGSPTLNSQKWFNWARTCGPSVAGMAVLEDNAATAELFFYLARRGLAGNSRDISAAPGQSIVGKFTLQSLDFKLLPDFKAVSKYFGPSILQCLSRADGFAFDFRLLDSPPQ